MFIFDEDISVSVAESKPLVLSGEVSPNWSVNYVPNGGYLMALVANAMMQQVEEEATAAVITANYVARCKPGKADIVVDKFSGSRQFDRVQANLIQNDKERIRVFGTFAKAGQGNSEIHYEKKPPILQPVGECIGMPYFSDGYSIFEQLDVRLDPNCAGWLEGKLINKSEHKGWIKFKDERPFDLLSLLLLADSFPPPVFASQGMVAWVPTIEFSVNVRAIPESNWLKAVFRTRFITSDLLEEDGELWDENDNLVAISRQIAQYKKLS